VTLRAFVSAAYALMVRTYAGIPGKTLLEAIDLANETFGMKTEEQIEAAVESQNEQSLKRLEALMAGV